MNTLTPLRRGLPRSHPGELLREVVLPATELSKAEIARMLGLSRTTLYDILGEKQPITAQVAVRLGKLFGNGPALWMNMQAHYDVEQAEKALAEELERIPTIQAT